MGDNRDRDNSPLSWNERVDAFFVNPPSPLWTRMTTLCFNTILVTIIFWVGSGLDVFQIYDSRPRDFEVDLSGIWKLSLEDNKQFASVDYDDSQWCPIDVPGSRMDPALVKEPWPNGCDPKQMYPREKMRNSTFWYRKTFTLPEGFTLKEPSLFLGTVKRQAWVFWDGEQIGTGSLATAPTVISLSREQIRAGTHLLAVRVEAEDDANPGVFHGFNRKVTVGEMQYSAEAVIHRIQHVFLQPLTVFLLQLMAFLVVFILNVRLERADASFFWLSNYFGASAFYSLLIVSIENPRWAEALQSLMLLVMTFSMVGYSIIKLESHNADRFWKSKVTGLLAFLFVGLKITLLLAHNEVISVHLDKIVTIAAMTYVLVFAFARPLWKQMNGNLEWRSLEFLSAIALVSLHALVGWEIIIAASNSAVFINLPFYTSTLTVVVLALAVEDYVQKQRRLAFFGRFIRPGLKDFLHDQIKNETIETKLIRPRQIPILKIDIVDFTKATATMPYGARRLYQDLWYYHIDEVLEGMTLLDKPEGDGSIYYLRDDLPGGSCNQGLQAAQAIMTEAVAKFDKSFRKQLKEFLALTPEIEKPFERFLQRFQEIQGHDFWEHHTKVRAVFVYGYVDEGLWGLTEQSHYDLSGTILIELARLEKLAGEEEFLLSKAYFEVWQKQGANGLKNYHLEKRRADLKGLGLNEFYVLKVTDLNHHAA